MHDRKRGNLGLEDLPEEIFDKLSKETNRNLKNIVDETEDGSLISKMPTGHGDGYISVKGEDIRRLFYEDEWLNDEIVNAVGSLINKRNKDAKFKSVMLNSFFYDKLRENLPIGHPAGTINFSNVERWTKNVDVAGLDQIIIPINIGNVHWTLGVVNLHTRIVAYIDSLDRRVMPNIHNYHIEQIQEWLIRTITKQRGQVYADSLDVRKWASSFGGRDFPKQKDRSSCGVFMLVTAMYMSTNNPNTWKQENMKDVRRSMAHAILRKHLGATGQFDKAK